MTKQIRALARGLTVVNAIDSSTAPVSLSDLHRITQIDKATLLRIIATLEHEGWVYRGIGDNRYRLTYKLHDLGRNVSIHNAIAEASAPVLDELQNALHWPSDISVFDGTSMVIIETSRSRSTFVLNRQLLGYRPSMLKSAMGRVYLAFCDERRRNAILQKMIAQGGREGEIAGDSQYIHDMIVDIREKGFATRDSSVWKFEYDEDFMAMAVPVIVKGEVQASLNLVWMRDAVQDRELERNYFEKLLEAAARLERIFIENDLY